MTNQWGELKRLFEDVSNRPRAEWRALVDSVAARDRSLADELDALLRAHAASDSFLESSPFDLSAVADTDGLHRPRLEPGAQLGPYEIVALLGAGGMGEVYRARDPRLARDVAIKILPADFARDVARHRRMEKEAKAVGMLNHPNTLTVYDVGLYEGSPFIVSEILEGQTLRAALEASQGDSPGGMALDEACRIIRETAEGLGAAHSRGIVHRDLKPENVFLTHDGRVKILDFGIAKLKVDDPQRTHTIEGTILGTVGYMAPEQIRGQTAEPPADVFAAGAILYELLTGRRAFAEATAADTCSAVLTRDPTPLRSLYPSAPDAVVTIVDRCLSKDPEARYASGVELAAALKAGPIAASVRAPGRGARRLAAAAAALALIAIIAAAAFWLRPRSMTPSGGAEPPLVAVLPFQALSQEDGQRAFADGMTDEMRGQLSKLSGLRLLSRTAMAPSADTNLTQLAKDHGVGSVVEGRVRRDGARVRIAVELISASTQLTLWSDSYDRTLDDVFAVQSDVAVRVAEALRARISPEERTRVEKPPTSNVQAYGLYLETLSGHPVQNRDLNLAAVNLLKRAVEMDPTFALARARLAYRTMFLGRGGDRATANEAVRLAREAVRSDPMLAEAHNALATSLSEVGQTQEARTSFLRALELEPSHATAMANLSVLEANNGHYDESLRWAWRGFSISGKRANDYYHLLSPYVVVADPAVGRRALELAERRFPDEPRLQLIFAAYEHQYGDTTAALVRIQRLAAAHP